MPDLDLSLLVSRDLFGLNDLELNDWENFYVSRTFLGGAVTWNRNKVSSPWADGEVETYATRGDVQESIQIEVLGDSAGGIQENLNDLVAAFGQVEYNITVTLDDAQWVYACKAADITHQWIPERFVAGQALVTVAFPRHPIPVNDGALL